MVGNSSRHLGMTVMSRKKIHDEAKSGSHHSFGAEYFIVQSRTVQNVALQALEWARIALSRYSDSLRAGRSGDRIPVGARFSAPVQTGPGAHPASCKMGTGSFPGVKRPGVWR